jgi:glycosyltransferase involved in cell wall biosynthesis
MIRQRPVPPHAPSAASPETIVAPTASAPRTPLRGLDAYRNAHAGETLVVCGCGPSLTTLAHPERYVTIGVNDVGRLFDPTYLVVVNPRTQFREGRFRHVEQSGARALFTQLPLGRVRPSVVRFRLGRYGGTEPDADDVLHYTQNSPYVAVCLAAYMGAARIGLIGVDLTDHHFFARTGRHPLARRLRQIDAQYGRLAAALAARGVELVNLSPISRLASLPRARVEEGGGWTLDPAARPEPRTDRMKVTIEQRGNGAVGALLEALADTAARMGHPVERRTRRAANDPQTLAIVWNGRTHRATGPTLYCEHGWLPRSAYQISPAGINADSDLAPFRWDGVPLTAQQDAALDAHLAAIKTASFSGYNRYMQAAAEAADDLPPEFLLVPLQMEGDTNLVRHAPAELRRMQGLVDHVSRVDPPWPVIFKQHPADVRRGDRHLRLRMRRRKDLLWPHSRGNVHQMLKSGACRGILTINSNVAHDGLLWDVPAIVLGRNVWSAGGGRLPFLTASPRDWEALARSVASPEGRACRRAYAHYLMEGQWTLEHARDPERVAQLFDEAVRWFRDRRRSPSTRMPVAGAKVTEITRRAPAGPRRERMINVVAENRGWLFEAWKQRLASAPLAGFRVLASARPLRQADAWIFVRAREAAATPDFSRTVVQLHDLLDGGVYAPGGERACVARCAGLLLTHPAQRELLAASGIEVGQRRSVVQPVGWGSDPGPRAPGETPTVAWIGRPSRHGGEEVARLDRFVEAARSLGGVARVVLVGERLAPAAAELRRAGVECTAHGPLGFPLDRAAAWIGRFDCVVITGGADTGPWPLFDALHAGVPVVAPPVGWAARLLADGRAGFLADDPAAIARAVGEVLADRAEWAARAGALRERVAEHGMAAWLEANLSLAAELARQPVRKTA